MIIPDTSGGEISDQLKIARGRLQLVPNKMFEELVMDLYDEVDRREIEASELFIVLSFIVKMSMPLKSVYPPSAGS